MQTSSESKLSQSRTHLDPRYPRIPSEESRHLLVQEFENPMPEPARWKEAPPPSAPGSNATAAIPSRRRRRRARSKMETTRTAPVKCTTGGLTKPQFKGRASNALKRTDAPVMKEMDTGRGHAGHGRSGHGRAGDGCASDESSGHKNEVRGRAWGRRCLGEGRTPPWPMDAATCEQPPGLHRRLAPREHLHRRRVPSR